MTHVKLVQLPWYTAKTVSKRLPSVVMVTQEVAATAVAVYHTPFAPTSTTEQAKDELDATMTARSTVLPESKNGTDDTSVASPHCALEVQSNSCRTGRCKRFSVTNAVNKCYSNKGGNNGLTVTLRL